MRHHCAREDADMRWLKDNWVPLAVGVAAGYFLAKSGGLQGVTARAKGAVSG
jgi:hypothetical protein